MPQGQPSNRQKQEQEGQGAGPGQQDQAGDAGEPKPYTDIKNLLEGNVVMPRSTSEMIQDGLKKSAKARSRQNRVLGSGDEVFSVAKSSVPTTWHISHATLTRIRTATLALRSRLSSLLQARTLARCYPAHTGKRLDARNLFRLAVRDGRIFRRKTETAGLDTAVHILLDTSGSMHSRIDTAVSTCFVLASALWQAGVSVGVSVFPSDPYQPYPTIGTLLAQGGRLTSKLAMTARGTTPLGPAIWALLPRLSALKQARKLLIVLTDGEPDSEPAAKAALADAERSGVEVIGIGIDTVSTELLFKKHAEVRTVDDLPEAMFRVLSANI